MKLRVFASTRLIKDFLSKEKSTDALLDKAMSVSDFLENVCFVPAKKASSYEQILLMQKACLKSKELESSLGISSEFFNFLKNKDYLFSFFKELALAKKDIKDISHNDTYALYDEHLAILAKVFKDYLSLLAENELYDDISLTKNYSLNLDFLSEYEGVIYKLEGFLNKFEADLLQEISSKTELILSFKTSKFNIESLQKIDFLSKLKLELNFSYELNLSKNELKKTAPFVCKNKQIIYKSFKQRLLQAPFIFDEASRFIRAGLRPENIVIITPDENVTPLLSALDFNKNLNFANGISIKQSLFYQSLKALFDSANLDEFSYYHNIDYFDNKDQIFDYANSILHLLKLDFASFVAKFNLICDFDFFKDLIISLAQNENTELKASLSKELLFIKDLLKNEKLKLKELIQLFFIQINTLKQSFVGGGKLSVMGLLESRGLEIDGVIVVDFNDDFVPQTSSSELFLNSFIRERSGLISHTHHENLQRFYYESLFKNAKMISISFVLNDEKMKSRFLDELDFRLVERDADDRAYLHSLDFYESKMPNLIPLDFEKEKELFNKHDFFKFPLSFSRLELFLKAKITYFYKYILGLSEARALSFESVKARNAGNFLHDFLQEFYAKFSKNSFDSPSFWQFFSEKTKPLNALDTELLRLKFKDFEKEQKAHFDKGWAVFMLEKECEKSLSLGGKDIRLKGRIDRIDKHSLSNEFLIIDYKSGKIYEDSYQLAFYQLLFNEDASVFFYDLNELELTRPKKIKSIEELRQVLEQIMQKWDFELINEDKDRARYCPYALIYKKELK